MLSPSVACCRHWRPNNANGLCFVGRRGVGKSYLLRSVALAATTLLPNFVAVTIDATRGSTANVRPDQSAVCVLGALKRQYAVLGVPGMAKKKTVSSMLDVARRNGLATGVFVDDARHLYMRTAPAAADAEADQPLDSSWEQVHEVLEDFCGCAFFADGMAVLPAMVRAEQTRLNDLGYAIVRTSLNSKRMRIVPVEPLLRLDQYRTYCGSRAPYQQLLAGLDDKSKDDLYRAWHVMSGGCLRDLEELYSANYVKKDTVKHSVPAPGTLGHHLLRALYRQGCKSGGPVDPFDVPSLTESAMMKAAGDFYNNHSWSTGVVYAELVQLVESGVLGMSDNAGKDNTTYTFGSPAQWMALAL